MKKLRRVQQRKQKLLNLEVKEFRKSELLEKYIAKKLFRSDDGKFKDEFLKKLERSWTRQKERQISLEVES